MGYRNVSKEAYEQQAKDPHAHKTPVFGSFSAKMKTYTVAADASFYVASRISGGELWAANTRISNDRVFLFYALETGIEP